MKATNRLINCGAIALVMLAPVSAGAAHPGESGTDKLETFRQSIKSRRIQTTEINGFIMRIPNDNRIVTTITTSELRKNHFGEGDQLMLELGDKKLRAVLLTATQFSQAQGASPSSIDANVACVVNDPAESSRMEIIGLGGELADWLGAKPGMKLRLEKSAYFSGTR